MVKLQQYLPCVCALPCVVLCYLCWQLFLSTAATLLIIACVVQQIIAEAHQHVTSELIHRMIDEFKGAQEQQDAHSKEAALPSIVEMMDSSADNQAPAVHSSLHQPCTDVTHSQIRKRKVEELPSYQNKRVRMSSSQDCMQSDSDCEVQMECI